MSAQESSSNDPDVSLTLPMSAAIEFEAELLAKFNAEYVARSLGIRRVGVAMATVALVSLMVLAGLFYAAKQYAFAAQMTVLLGLAGPATLEKHLELSRLTRARREIFRRRGISPPKPRFSFFPSRS
jgi:hypothetical protein